MICCGHCRGRHATIAEVRACSTGEREQILADLDAEQHIERLLESPAFYGLR